MLMNSILIGIGIVIGFITRAHWSRIQNVLRDIKQTISRNFQ